MAKQSDKSPKKLDPSLSPDDFLRLIEHMPKGPNGETLIDASAAKPKVVEGTKGPQITVGFSLGGIKASQKALPEVIEIKPEPESDDKE